MIDKSRWAQIGKILAYFPRLDAVSEAGYDGKYFMNRGGDLAKFMQWLGMEAIWKFWDTDGASYHESLDEVFDIPNGIFRDHILDAGMSLPRFLPSTSHRLTQLSCTLLVLEPRTDASSETTLDLLNSTLTLLHTTRYPLLSSLSLQIVLSGRLDLDKKLLAAVKDMLLSTEQLKTLELNAVYFDIKKNMHHLDHLQEILPMSWPRLKSLALSCSTTKSSLLRLLSSHRDITMLDLSNMFMWDGDWVSFFRETPALEHLRKLDLNDLYDSASWTYQPNVEFLYDGLTDDVKEELRFGMVRGGPDTHSSAR